MPVWAEADDKRRLQFFAVAVVGRHIAGELVHVADVEVPCLQLQKEAVVNFDVDDAGRDRHVRSVHGVDWHLAYVRDPPIVQLHAQCDLVRRLGVRRPQPLHHELAHALHVAQRALRLWGQDADLASGVYQLHLHNLVQRHVVQCGHLQQP
eukprot:530118-Rhodomonas_salina.3